MADYAPPTSMKQRNKDSNKLKRNMSVCFLHSIAIRASIIERCREKTFGGIAKLISVAFNVLTAKERTFWDD